MSDIVYSNVPTYKISVIGSASVGKTSICARIVNNYFTALYEPTIDIGYYTKLVKITDAEVSSKIYILATLEDFFGLNNPILKPENTTNSEYILKKKEKMTESFRQLMFTSVKKRDELSKEAENIKSKKFDTKKDKDPKYLLYENIFSLDKSIERQGYIIVVDITDHSSIEDAKTIIDKLQQIEKTSNLSYPKCIFINKIDRIIDKKLVKAFMTEVEQLKAKQKLDIYKVSALNNSGVSDAFRKFLSKIHQANMDKKQNEGLEEKDFSDEEEDPITCNDKWNSCTRKVCCGTGIFSCGTPEDEEEKNSDTEDA